MTRPIADTISPRMPLATNHPIPSSSATLPDANGNFAGQTCYGYQSIADFILGHRENLATIETTRNTTAILEAGRKSLDTGLRVEL